MVTNQPILVQTSSLHAYPGGYFRLLVSPDPMSGNVALIDLTAGRGGEAPLHVHTREDELFCIIEGSVRFRIGDEVIVAGPGQTVLAPRNVPHQFNILTEQARMLNLFTPGHFINYILDWSQPLDKEPATLQVQPGPPPADVMAKRAKQLEEQYGVRFA